MDKEEKEMIIQESSSLIKSIRKDVELLFKHHDRMNDLGYKSSRFFNEVVRKWFDDHGYDNKDLMRTFVDNLNTMQRNASYSIRIAKDPNKNQRSNDDKKVKTTRAGHIIYELEGVSGMSDASARRLFNNILKRYSEDELPIGGYAGVDKLFWESDIKAWYIKYKNDISLRGKKIKKPDK